jgi:hypothetical protein
MEAYAANPECCAIRDLILNPSKMCRKTLKSVHYSYQQPLCQSLIMIEDKMLIFREPIQGSTSYTCLQIVPKGLYDIIFIAFHSNPIGKHLNASALFIDCIFAIIGLKRTPSSNGLQRLSRLRPLKSHPQYIIRTCLSFSHRSSILSPLC